MEKEKTKKIKKIKSHNKYPLFFLLNNHIIPLNIKTITLAFG